MHYATLVVALWRCLCKQMHYEMCVVKCQTKPHLLWQRAFRKPVVVVNGTYGELSEVVIVHLLQSDDVICRCFLFATGTEG